MSTHQTITNQFLGINPLLHSHLQTAGQWDNFHMNHISDLTRFLQRELRPLGYYAQAEQSLQIRRPDSPVRSPESDVTIYSPLKRPPATTTPVGGLTLSVPDLLNIDEAEIATYRAVGLYQKAGDDSRGDAVAWLELLSPSNKPGGRHFETYREKRNALLQAGLVFIELDYLHHQPATVAVPKYPDEMGSSCYRIVVIVPRPDWLRGEGRVYAIQVDEQLPKIPIPLNTDDVLDFDFDAPYQQTYEALFFGDQVDYGALPPAWERYNESDQARILTRLLALRDTSEKGENPPQKLEPLPLADALGRWHG